MWEFLWVLLALVVLVFAFVVAFGAPFLPTLSPQVKRALDLMDLKPGETLLELGSGDGRVLLAAAKRGLTVVGYELNPLLVMYARVRTRRYRSQVKVVWGNFWKADWPPAQGIFVFLLNPYMKKLDKKITQELGKNVKVVSYAFQIPGRKPAKELNGLYLYKY